MYFGIALLTCNIWFIIVFILVFWLYYERIMYAEEQFLRRKFGEEYISWSEGIPAFIPKFNGFIRPSLSFSWKKIIKKEKNGIFAMFLIFCAFNLTGYWIRPEYIHVNYALIALAALTGISYIVIKIIKKTSGILDEEGR